MRTSPQWFSDAIQELQSGMQLNIPKVTVHNLWDIFSTIHQAIQTFDNIWLATPSNDPSKTISAQDLDLQLLIFSSNQP
jgi:hypothetical protein